MVDILLCALYIASMNENRYRLFKAVLATATVSILSTLALAYINKQRAEDAEFFCNGAPITIQEGDTLYWITRTNCDGNKMHALDVVVDFYGDSLKIGDTIYLPTHNNCELRFTDGGQVMEDCA